MKINVVKIEEDIAHRDGFRQKARSRGVSRRQQRNLRRSYTKGQKKEISERIKGNCQKLKIEKARHKDCQSSFIDGPNEKVIHNLRKTFSLQRL